MDPDSAPVLQMDIDRQPATTIVHCTGKINTDSWTEFSVRVRALIPEGKPIRVDLSQVEQIDSTGIGTLVQVWGTAKQANCDLKYINPHKQVEDVIEITRLFPLFELPERGAGSKS